MKKRLQTILAHAGVASRRHAAALIEGGKVTVDGRCVTERGFRVDPDMHEIVVEGKRLPGEEKKCYFLFNKPAGVVSTAQDTHASSKVTDFFKDIDARLYPVGRLDKNTTGILIMTNDGRLTHRLAHPSYVIEKEYRVTAFPRLSDVDLKRLKRGIEIDGKLTARCSIKFIGEKNGAAVYTVKLHEGRNRQIKRMFETAEAKVLELERFRYAGLELGSLKPGAFRRLTKKEVAKLEEKCEIA